MGCVVNIKTRSLLTLGERTSATCCTGGWVGPRAGLDTSGKKSFASRGDRTPSVQSVVRHYTDFSFFILWFYILRTTQTIFASFSNVLIGQHNTEGRTQTAVPRGGFETKNPVSKWLWRTAPENYTWTIPARTVFQFMLLKWLPCPEISSNTAYTLYNSFFLTSNIGLFKYAPRR
jgi:hypothetical protein